MLSRRKVLPAMLLIGDSIRLAYAPLVARALKHVAKVITIKENCEDSAKIRANIKRWMHEAGPLELRAVHLNSGLHDIKRAFGSNKYQQPLPAYIDNWRWIVATLREMTDARLIWATTTPVIYERHHARKGFDRFNEDVIKYNEAALAIMKETNVPVNDLYDVITRYGKERAIKEDGVHMTRAGNRALAAAVTVALRGFL